MFWVQLHQNPPVAVAQFLGHYRLLEDLTEALCHAFHLLLDRDDINEDATYFLLGSNHRDLTLNGLGLRLESGVTAQLG